MSIRNRIAYGYALVLGLAIAGTTTGLALGNHQQRRALAIRELAATEQQLLNDLQIRILYNRPANQLSPYLNDRDRFRAESQKLLDRIDQIQTMLDTFETLTAEAEHDHDDNDHDELHDLLESYQAAVAAFRDRTQQFVAAIEALPTTAAATPEAQTLLLGFVRSPEFINFIQLPDQIEPFVARIAVESQAAEVALQRAEAVRTQIIWGSLLAAALIASVLAWRTSQAIGQPLMQVTAVARRVTEENNFDLQAPVVGHDEISLLAESLNQLIHQVRHLLSQVQQKNTDLSEALAQLEEQQLQLVQSEKMSSLGQLVAGVAHEINNPVNFIHGNISHVKEHLDDVMLMVTALQTHHPEAIAALTAEHEDLDLDFIQEDLGKILTSMRVGTDRIRQIVLSLRNFSRLDEADYKAVDIHEGLDSSLMILQHRFKAKPERPAIQLIQNSGDLPPVECYPGQLNQVVINILTNAIDAIEERYLRAASTPAQAPLAITLTTTHPEPDWVEIVIADTGMGMTPEVQARLFSTFFTTKPRGVGTGLGMSISHKIITETHHGELSFTSTPGVGTEFRIRIPRRQPLAAPGATAALTTTYA
ncbi:MAG TPA: ATP-binding protein [Candidatus Obscuribacterales bacterium]